MGARHARWLLNLGILATVVGLSKVHARWVADPPYDFTASSRFGWALAYCAVLMILAYGVGLPDLTRTRQSELGASMAAGLGAAVLISAVQLLTGDARLPRFVVFGSAIILVDWFHLCCRFARRDRADAEDRDRVVVVGIGANSDVLADELGRGSERAAVVVASLEPAMAETTGDRCPLIENVESLGAAVVVLDRDAQSSPSVIAQAAALHERGVRIRTLSLFYEEWLGKLPVNELERVSLMFDIGELHRARYGRVKRLADIAIAAVGAVVLLVATPFVLFGNLVANRGPLLYKQDRIGRAGARFGILKLRTMRPGEVDETTWTSEDDPRITPFGRFLRRTHLDELPQVVNVLRGDLSIVGPRPEQPHYVDELSAKLPFYDLRHLVRPGLTGWAQVKYPYGADEADAQEKLQYEFFYLRHQSLAFDARILVRTIRAVIGVGGR